MWDRLKVDILEASALRAWASLPASFEVEAVRHLAGKWKHELKGLIAGRIAVNRATSFVDLLAAVNLAETEHGKRLEKARLNAR